jgi:hypothetical protein
MACVPVSTGSIPSGVKSITRKLVFFVSPLSTHVIMQKEQRLVGLKSG